MSRPEAEAYVRSCGEDDGPDSYDDAAELFEALFGRRPEADDGDQGELWSHCCAHVEMVVRPATDDELGGRDAERFWAAFDENLFRVPRKFRSLLTGRSVLCSEAEHDELMGVVRELPGRDVRPLRVWR